MKLHRKSVLLVTACFLLASSAVAGGNHLFIPLEKLQAAHPGVKINRDVVRGGGVIAGQVLENEGAITLCDLPSIVQARVINRGTIEIVSEQAVFTDDFFNTGTLKTTDTVVRFDGLYQEDGVYISDPSDNYFWDLYIGAEGYLVGGEGDNFYIRGDFISASTQNQNWSTGQCLLEFTDGFRDGAPDLDHDFSITGMDLGPLAGGYIDNFAWGILHIATGNSLQLLDGNTALGGALYVGMIGGLDITGSTVTNISSPDGINIYYQADLAENDDLGGDIFDFADAGGQLIPIWAKSPDIDHDGDVDGHDVALLAADMNSTCPSMSACPADLDDDGQVDGADLILLAPYFGQTGL